jgi:hypothetical protein
MTVFRSLLFLVPLLSTTAGAAPFPPLPALHAGSAPLSISGFTTDGVMVMPYQIAFSGVLAPAHDVLPLEPGSALTDGSEPLAAMASADPPRYRPPAVAAWHLRFQYTLPGAPGLITTSARICPSPPHISFCRPDGKGYDQAGALLYQIYGPLFMPARQPHGTLLAFNQREFASADSGLAAVGHLYLPQACRTGTPCRIHVALHACPLTGTPGSGASFYRHAGYNEWADSNALLILYPQLDGSDASELPSGCWDGFRRTPDARSVTQWQAIRAMLARLSGTRQSATR